MMSLSRNLKIVLAAAAAVALVAGFWMLVLGPQRKQAADLEAKISKQRGSLTQAKRQMATYEQARAAYKANYAKLVSLGKAVPADDDVRSFMVQLDASTKASHVDFQNVEVGGGASAATPTASTTGTAPVAGKLAPAPGLVPIGTTGVSALPFTMKFNGGYFNLSNLFARLDRYVAVHNQQVKAGGRLLRIESFAIAPSGAGWPDMTAAVGAASYVTTPVDPVGGTTGTQAAGTTTPSTSSSSSTTPPASSGGSTSTTTATVTGAAR